MNRRIPMKKKKWKNIVLLIAIIIIAIAVLMIIFALVEEAVTTNQTKKLNTFDGSFHAVWQEYSDNGIDYVLDIEERYPDIYRQNEAYIVIPQEFFDLAKSEIQMQSDARHKLVIASVVAAAVEPLASQNYGGFSGKASDIITYDIFKDMRPDEYFELFDWDKSNNDGQCFRTCFYVLDWPKYTLQSVYDELSLEMELLFRGQFYDLIEEPFDISPIALPDEQLGRFSLSVENVPINRGGKILICRSSFGFVDAPEYLTNWRVYESDMCTLDEAQRAYSIEQADYVLLFQTTYKEGSEYDIGLPSYRAISTAYIFDTDTYTCVFSHEISASPPVSIQYKLGDPITPGDYDGAGKLSAEEVNNQFETVLAMIKDI